MKAQMTAAVVTIAPMQDAQVVTIVPLTDWLDVSAFEDVYIPMLNVDLEGEQVTFHVEMAEDPVHPFVNRPTFTLARGESDAFIERSKFFRYVRLSAESTSPDPVDVRFGVFGKGNSRGTSEGAWKLG